MRPLKVVEQTAEPEITEADSWNGRLQMALLAPNGVQKLRELILELAVRGKLVSQDPNYEPASELLKKIEAQKKKLIKEGKIKKQELPIPVEDSEKIFKLPKGWEWVRLSEIGLVTSSNRVHQREWQASGIPFYRAREIVKLSVDGFVENELFISENLYKEKAKKGIVPEQNDIMITGVGTIGVPYVVKQDEVFYFKDASVLILKNFFNLHPEFLYYFMKSPFWNRVIHKDSMGTTVHTFTISRANLVPIPLPPIEEQKAIVAKINELMALCDTLEGQKQDTASAHEMLVKTLLGTLTQSQNTKEFNENWQRISKNFNILFATEASIDALKKTILQLAVMGKLVAQNPKDESANKLLERIKSEKEKLFKAGKIKSNNLLPEISGDEKPYVIPNNWVWSCLGEVSIVNPRNNVDVNKKASFVPMAMIQKDLEGSHEQEEKMWEEIKQGFTHFAEGDIGVAKITPCFENSKACIFKNLVNGIGAGTTELHIVRPISETLVPRYVLAYLKSPEFLYHGERKMTGTAGQKRLPKDFVEKNPFPLPPLSEQKRIVERLDELTSLCDGLKENITKYNSIHEQLAAALVEKAVAA